MQKKNLFISYRRGDGAGDSGRIYDRLKEKFNVFFDTDKINIGEDFSNKIRNGIEESEIILVIIAENSCKEFQNRINQDDYVVNEILYAKELDKDIIPILINNAKMPKECLPREISFFSMLNACSIEHRKFDGDIDKFIKKVESRELKIKSKDFTKRFNDADALLRTLGSKRKLYFEDTRKDVKYQFWGCGRDINPDYYLIFFPSTIYPLKAAQNFLIKCENENRKIPRYLTILKDTMTYQNTFDMLRKRNIEIDTFKYSDFYWDECITDEIKNYKYNIEVDPYYVEQDIYAYSDIKGDNPLGNTYGVIKHFIQNDSSEPIMLILAQAGAGKTTFIESFIKHIDDMEKTQAIFISSETLKETLKNHFVDTKSLTEISSIYQLYSEYIKICNIQEGFSIDENDFHVGLVNGAIVLIVDGLDEIISLYGERFRLNSFIDSLIKFNNQLGQCKIIITSREYYWKENPLLDIDEILTYKLQGFDNNHLKKYLDKRYSRFAITRIIEEHMSRTHRYLKQSEAINDNNKVIPYIVSMLCQAVEDEIEYNLDTLRIKPHTYYSSNQRTIDKVIFSIFEREISRQAYPKGFTVRDLAYIFINLSVDYGEVFSFKKLTESIELKYPESYNKIIDSLKFSPLLIVNQRDIQLKYDFLENYFICLHIINEFENVNSLGCSIRHLAKLHKAESPLFKDIEIYFTNKKQTVFMVGARNIIFQLLEKYNKIKSQDEVLKLQIQQSISAILYLLIAIYGKALPSKNKMDLIKEIYNQDNKIKNLFIFGNFYELDFSNIEIWDSVFNNYTNFSNSKFNNTKLYYTELVHMDSIQIKKYLWDKIEIDATCETYGLIKQLDIAKEQQSMVDKLKSIFEKLTKTYSVDKNRQTIIDKMNCLLEFGFITKEENNAKIIFKLNQSKKNNVKQFLKNGSTSNISIKNVLDCFKTKKH